MRRIQLSIGTIAPSKYTSFLVELLILIPGPVDAFLDATAHERFSLHENSDKNCFVIVRDSYQEYDNYAFG